ncbi:50S ribosomal protein L5 [Eubacteriales bacterium OttesenSCG-928-M02]|nr:50S ribosomal protein L5 [Eubacteriales bacterium OttesenSCG-928-M02]
MAENYKPRLKERFEQEIIPAMSKQFGYTNVNQVPKLEKIVLNMGLGDTRENPKGLESAVNDMETICGQKAIVTKAKKSVANFRLRAGMNVGAKVTLRGNRMYEFADRLMNVALPRVRDFRGLKDSSFDGRGNYSMGIREQLIFPEIDYEQIDKIRGMDIIFVTTAKTDEEALELLSYLGMPFARENQ